MYGLGARKGPAHHQAQARGEVCEERGGEGGDTCYYHYYYHYNYHYHYYYYYYYYHYY